LTDARRIGAVAAVPQPFEEALLGMLVWRVTVDGAARPDDVAALAVSVRVEGVGLAMCRLADGDPAIPLFMAAGFRVVEVLLTHQAPLEAAAEVPAGIRVASEADIAACRAIAAASFRFDRFHADPAIDDSAADAQKAQWIENAVRGRADTVLVAETDGAVSGFNACHLRGETAVIDLIAVHPEAQGRGIGHTLVAGAFAHYAGRARVLQVGTQEDNRASRRLYERFGFAPVTRQVTLHWTPGAEKVASPSAAGAVADRPAERPSR